MERTRFRETPHFRSKTRMETLEPASETKPEKQQKKKSKKEEQASEKPGKKEKIRFGKAPNETLPSHPQGPTEDAGAGAQQAQAAEPENPLEQAPPEHKTRFSDRARTEKKHKKAKSTVPAVDPYAQPAPDAADVADRQTQSAPLGLGAHTEAAKKKHKTSNGEKTRLSDEKKKKKDETPVAPTPIPQVQGAPAPTTAPAPQQ